MKKLLKTLSSFLATTIILVSVLSGCMKSTDSNAGTEKKPTESAAKTTTTGEQTLVNKTGLPIVNQPLTYNIMVAKHFADKTTWSEKEAIKKAEAETGIKFDWVEVQASAWAEKLSVTLATRNLPDVIIGDMPNLSMFTESFAPLNKLIEEYSPVFSEFMNKYPQSRSIMTMPDGNIYSLPLIALDGNYTTVRMTINKTWLDNLNLKVPETVDELYSTLKAFKENDPNNNGKKDEIPYGFFGTGDSNGNAQAYGIDHLMWNFGLINDDNYHYVMVEDEKVLFVPTDKRYYQYLEFLNKLYREGLIDMDGFSQKEQEYQAKGKEGLYGLFNHHSYDDIVVGPELVDHYISILPMKNDNGSITVEGKQIPGDIVYHRYKITKECKNPEAMVRLWDYVNSDFSTKMLWTWGVENEAWKKNDDGTISKITDRFPEGINNYAELRQTRGVGMAGFFAWTEEDAALFKLDNKRDVKLYETTDLYVPYLKEERIPLGADLPEITAERNIMYTEIKTYLENFRAEAVIKGIDEKKWAEHLKNCEKLNIDKYLQDYQNFYNRKSK